MYDVYLSYIIHTHAMYMFITYKYTEKSISTFKIPYLKYLSLIYFK